MFGRPPCRNAGGFLFPLHQVSGHFQHAAAGDLVHESPQSLVLPFPLHQVCGVFRRGAAVDLVHESPQSLVLSFLLHQVCGLFQGVAAVDLVHESPQGLVLPFPLHQVSGHFRRGAAGKRDLNHRLCDFCSKRSIINDQYFQLKKGTKKAKYYTSTKTSKTIKKLAKKKTYSVKIRSYKKISGKTYYGTWSGIKKVKIK